MNQEAEKSLMPVYPVLQLQTPKSVPAHHEGGKIIFVSFEYAYCTVCGFFFWCHFISVVLHESASFFLFHSHQNILWHPRKTICNNIQLSCNVEDLIVEFLKLQNPAIHFGIRGGQLEGLCDRFAVRIDENLGTKQKVTILDQKPENCIGLSLRLRPTGLDGIQNLAEKHDRMCLSIGYFHISHLFPGFLFINWERLNTFFLAELSDDIRNRPWGGIHHHNWQHFQK